MGQVALFARAVALQAAQVSGGGQGQHLAAGVAGAAAQFGGSQRLFQRRAAQATAQVVAGHQQQRAVGGAVVAVGAPFAKLAVGLQRRLRRVYGGFAVTLRVGQQGLQQRGVGGGQWVAAQAFQGDQCGL